MKVLHLVSGIGPDMGGLAAVALGLARGQLAAGADVSIWCFDDPEVARATAADRGLAGRVETFRIRGPRRLVYSPEGERAARERGDQFDVVHQHGLWTGTSRMALLMSRAGCRVMVGPHGSLEPRALRRSSWKKRLAMTLYERENLARARCLQATAEPERDTFRSLGVKKPVAVIPNGIDGAWLEARGDADRFRRTHRIPEDERLLLFLSRVHPIKGLPLLFQALARSRSRFAGWRLVVAGPSEAGHEAELRLLAARLGVSDLVAFVGPQYGSAKRDAFAAAELFVLPTLSENFAIVVVEALGAGVPVLTTHGTPWAELVRRRCGWWVPIDASEIAAALEEALGSSAEARREMGARGRDLVLERFTWESAGRTALDVYAWMMNPGIPAPACIDLPEGGVPAR